MQSQHLRSSQHGDAHRGVLGVWEPHGARGEQEPGARDRDELGAAQYFVTSKRDRGRGHPEDVLRRQR